MRNALWPLLVCALPACTLLFRNEPASASLDAGSLRAGTDAGQAPAPPVADAARGGRVVFVTRATLAGSLGTSDHNEEDALRRGADLCDFEALSRSDGGIAGRGRKFVALLHDGRRDVTTYSDAGPNLPPTTAGWIHPSGASLGLLPDFASFQRSNLDGANLQYADSTLAPPTEWFWRGRSMAHCNIWRASDPNMTGYSFRLDGKLAQDSSCGGEPLRLLCVETAPE